jgi:hypothetical protein
VRHPDLAILRHRDPVPIRRQRIVKNADVFHILICFRILGYFRGYRLRRVVYGGAGTTDEYRR